MARSSPKYTVLNAVRAPDPFHLIRGLQRFCNFFARLKLYNNQIHPLLAGVVDFDKVWIQLAREKHAGIERGAMLF